MVKRIYFIAGEASGDFLGGELIKAIQEQNADIEFSGIGAEAMFDAGLKSSLFDMSDLSVMGIAEILPKIPKLLSRISQTVEDIIQQKPDVIVTIDAPDFCFRVIKCLRKKGIKTPVVHYVAPTVWAWRPKRAQAVAQFLDHMLCLFPFEPSYFEKEGLKADFVGHPLVKTVPMHDQKTLDAFKDTHDMSKENPFVLLLPGSRRAEIDKLLPIFIETINAFKNQNQMALDVGVVAVNKHKSYIEGMINGHGIHIIEQNEKYKAIQSADCVLNASGTITLELALCQAPSINCYKVSFLTYVMLKCLAKAKYASLANILLDEPLVPEYLQYECTSDNLRQELEDILINEKGASQKARLLDVKSILTADPSAAANVVLSNLK